MNCWPYIRGVIIPTIEAEIRLLIKSNVPQALQPRAFRPSENSGLFATRTVLGWVLNSLLDRTASKSPTANFAQVEKTLDQQLRTTATWNSTTQSVNPKTMSRNDQRILDIMEKSVKLENAHYEIAHSWKMYPPNLQNNRTVAEHRLELLKKRFRREPQVHKKYKQFMHDLLSKDFPRKVETRESGPLSSI